VNLTEIGTVAERPLKVVITGTFLRYNKGGAAMGMATAQLFASHFPNCEITFLSPHSQKDRKVYSDHPVIACSRTQYRGLWVLIKASIWWLLRTVIRYDYRSLRADSELATYYQADLVVDLSGDTLTEDLGTLVLFSHLTSLYIAMSFGRPVVLFGQTIGPFKTWGWLVKLFLRRCAAIIARDDPTVEYLRHIGIPQELVHRSVDSAFFLAPLSTEDASEAAKSAGYDPETEVTVGITVSQLMEMRYKRKNSEAINRSFAQVMARAIDAIVARYDCRVILFPHVIGPREFLDDRIMARRVRDLVEGKASVLVVNEDLDPRLIKAMIGQCDAFIGCRMHSNIAALTMCVPTLAISYSVKYRGIMGMLGQQHRVIEIQNLDDEILVTKFDEIWQHRDSIRQELNAALNAVEQDGVDNMQVVRQVLMAHGRASS